MGDFTAVTVIVVNTELMITIGIYYLCGAGQLIHATGISWHSGNCIPIIVLYIIFKHCGIRPVRTSDIIKEEFQVQIFYT